MVVGLVQLQLPVVETPEHLEAQTKRICELVGKARRNLNTMDLVVFPEYALHGLSMSTAPELMVSLDGPEVAAFKAACVEHRIWGCFSIMEQNPSGNPYNSGLIIDDRGQIQLYYRKLHPWVPVEPWEPGNLGIPVCDGPNGVKLGLIICHDGMFPEDGARGGVQGRRADRAHRGLHRADPPRVEDHEPGQRVPEPAPTPRACACADRTARSIRWARACSARSTAP